VAEGRSWRRGGGYVVSNTAAQNSEARSGCKRFLVFEQWRTEVQCLAVSLLFICKDLSATHIVRCLQKWSRLDWFPEHSRLVAAATTTQESRIVQSCSHPFIHRFAFPSRQPLLFTTNPCSKGRVSCSSRCGLTEVLRIYHRLDPRTRVNCYMPRSNRPLLCR
jgi:hypothetical protein